MNCITILLTLLVISTSYYAANAREKHPFPPEFYAQQQRDGKAPPSILASHPDDIYWTDVSCKSGGLINYAYKTKVCDGALYVMGEDTDGYGVIGRYTKKDGWGIICDIYIEGSLSTFSVDGDDIYIGGNFTTAGEKQIPARNIVRYNVKSKEWYALGEGLWDPKIPNLGGAYSVLEAYKERVFIVTDYTHTGNKALKDHYIYWDGNQFIDEYYDFRELFPVRHNSLLYGFGVSSDSTGNVFFFNHKWNGDYVDEDTQYLKWDISERGVIGGYGFGIDSKNNHFFKHDYQYTSQDDSTPKSGTYFIGYIANKWHLLGGIRWSFNNVYFDNLLTEVDGDGQVYVAGIFREGIGPDKYLQSKYMQIVTWAGNDWMTMGSGISRFAGITSITYFDGDVYIGGGSGFSMAGDKPTYGFAKWNKRKVSSVDEQPLTSIPEVHLSPNPASDHITVELDNESNDCTITLFDLYGSNVGTYRLDGRRSTINTDHLSSGIYTLRVQYGGRIASTSMMIIR